MATVHHPAFPEIAHEVYGEKLDEHLRCGWILIPDTADPEPVQDVVPVVEHVEPAGDPAPDPQFEHPALTERATRRRRR